MYIYMYTFLNLFLYIRADRRIWIWLWQLLVGVMHCKSLMIGLDFRMFYLVDFPIGK